MDKKRSTRVLVVAVLVGTVLRGIVASDPELTSDFSVPAGVNSSSIDGNFFTFIGLRNFSAPAGTFASKKVTLLNFPALSGLGVGVGVVEFPPGTFNPPHHHPRGTEVLYIIEGSLDVGLVDSSGKLYTQTLEKGDLFVFPKGLVHFQTNKSSKKLVRGLASYSSSNAGTVSLPVTLFGSGISSQVLEKAFAVSPAIIADLEAPYVKLFV